MLILDKGESAVTRIMSKQRINFNTKYRKMYYTISVNDGLGVLLHNVISGTLVRLSEEEFAEFDNTSIIYSEILRELIEYYFLVPVDFDEYTYVQNLRRILLRIGSYKGISQFTIFTTTNCDARCFYCYEFGYTRMNLSERVADKIVEYIEMNRDCSARIELNWFGGEPLLGYRRINQICARLKEKSIDYCSNMTTNGYGFNSKRIGIATSLWNLQHVQITFDGDEEVYNQTKAYLHDDSNPFARVFNNVGKLLDAEVSVSLRIHITLDTLDSIYELADRIHDSYGEYPKLNVYSHGLLHNHESPLPKRTEKEKQRLALEQIKFSDYLSELGLYKRRDALPHIRFRSCAADSADAIVIYPDGRLYKCVDFEESDSVGHINSRLRNHVLETEYRMKFERDSCKICPLYPSCYILQKCPDYSKREDLRCSRMIEEARHDITARLIGMIS